MLTLFGNKMITLIYGHLYSDLMYEDLKQLGLSDAEVRTYVATLELGLSQSSKIAKKIGLPRTTTYDVLRSLEQKGLAGHVIKSGVMYFEAASPEKLISILKERQEKIAQLVPNLMALRHSAIEKPNVEVYEGREGLKTIIDDFITTKKPMLAISSTKGLTEKLVFYFPTYIKRRAEAKIPIKVITERSEQTIEMARKGKEEHREMRFIDKQYELPNAIFIYGEKVAIIDLEKNLSGVILQNPEINKTFRTIFDLMWNIAKKSN